MEDKIQKIREEIEKLKSQLIRGACSSQITMETRCKEEAYNEVLAIIDTMQEEPAPKVFEDMLNAKTAAESLGISPEEHDKIVDECLYGKEPELVDFDDMPLDPNIQYASREIAIKAHAEDYSFNIESELFQQLNKEQQELWRKEIEQACMSGGYCGLNLGLDKRYDKEEPVNEELEKAANEWDAKASFNPFYMALDNNGNPYEVRRDYITHAESFKAGAQWQKEKEYTCYEEAFEDGAKWKKEQMMAKSIEAVVSQVSCSNEIILCNPSSVYKYCLPQEMNKLGGK